MRKIWTGPMQFTPYRPRSEERKRHSMRCVEIEDRIVVDMIRRTCGGWLAVSAPGMMFKIGVTGPTEEETKERFRTSYRRWMEIYEGAALSR